MAKKWTDEHGSTPVKAGLGDLVTGLARRVFRKRGTARADSSQAKIMGDPEGKLLDYFKTKYGRSAQPIQAKKGKYQEFKHPQHNITPIEHMEEKVSSKERIEILLDERKKKKESKQKLVRAQEGQLIKEKTRGTGAAVKGTDHYVMQGMDAAQEGKLIQVPTRGTGQAVKGDQHYVMEGMDAAKEGKMIKAQSSKFIETVKDQSQEPPKWISSPGKRKRMGRKPSRGSGPKKISKEWIEWKKHDLETGGSYKTGGPIKAKESKYIQKKSAAEQGSEYADEILKTIKKKPSIVGKWDKSLKNIREIYKIAKENKKGDRLTTWDLENARKMIKSRELGEVDPGATLAAKGGPIKAKKGIWTGAATSMYDKPPGWDVKKISDKTHKKLTKLWKHREAGGWSPAAGKKYRAYLKGLKKITPSFGAVTSEQIASSSFLKKNTTAVGHLKKSKSYYFKDAPSSNFLERRKTLAGGRSFLSKEALKQIAKNISALPLVSKKTKVSTSMAKPSDFLSRRLTLGGARTLLPSPKILAVLKKVARKTAIGKGIAAATVVAGAYEAGKRKLFTKDKDKKKVTKKSIGGETVVMKSGGGYIDDLL
jgi:uncharacterized Zn-binding protein involved in type VI secretion